MTAIDLLYALKKECEDEIKDLLLPTSIQSIEDEKNMRAPEVHLMRLRSSADCKKKAPYLIIQYINGAVSTGENRANVANVRFIFCCYNENEENGALSLLNFMQRIKLRLASKPVIGDCFHLDEEKGIEDISYPDDTAPYYAGDMMAAYYMPEVRRSYASL